MQNMNMENHRRHSHDHNHSSRGFTRLFPSSCRFDAFTDVVESSTVAQNPKNLHAIKSISLNTQKHNPKSKTKFQRRPPLTVKQSSSSTSGLFSTEEDEEGVDSEIEIDDYFSFSSDSSLSSCHEIMKSRPNLEFSSRRIDELRICEVGPCSSSEPSTSTSSINSISPQKDPKPRLRVTLAEKFSHDSESFHPKTRTEKHLYSHLSVSGQKTGDIIRKIGETEQLCSNSSVFSRETDKFDRKIAKISSNSSAFGWKSGEINPKTKNLCAQSSVIFQKPEETKHISYVSHLKNTEIHPNPEIQLCPIYMRGKIEESYALEKESNDPYKDFRESMVEMIVEKKISRAEDLEKLLLCFISLNSSVFHRVILDVFSEICEAFIGR